MAAFVSRSDKTKEKTGFEQGIDRAETGRSGAAPLRGAASDFTAREVNGYVLGLALVLLGCLAITFSAILSYVAWGTIFLRTRSVLAR